MRRPTLALMLMLAGCAFPPANEVDDGVPAVPPEWRECRFTHRDGTPVDCDGTGMDLRNGQPLDPSFVCTFGAGNRDAEIRLLHSASESALYFKGSSPSLNLSGFVTIETDDGVFVFNWTSAGSEAFFPLGMSFLGKRATITYMVYRPVLYTNDPRLVGGVMSEAWSWHQGMHHAVFHVRVGSEEYMFYNLTRTPFGGLSGSGPLFLKADGYSSALHLYVLIGASLGWLHSDRCPPTLD